MNTLIGVGLVAIGAICGGLFALPSKFVEKTPWEVLWGLFFVFAALLIPVTGFFFVKGAWETWSGAGWVILYPILFGFLWGLGSAAAATAYKLIGISLGFAIIPGVQVVFGPLIPMFVQHPETIATTKGMVVILGILVSLAGVIGCGYAGVLRSRHEEINSDESRPTDTATANKAVQMAKGLFVCLFAGLLCACLNFAFSFGEPILNSSQDIHGNVQAIATLAVWMPALLGGCLAACGYCIGLLFKNQTWNAFKQPGIRHVALLAFLMAALHDGAIFFYGLGSQYLGVLGVSVGFALLFCGMMLVGNICGFMTGEWKGAASISRRWIMAGVTGLVLGICILAVGNALT